MEGVLPGPTQRQLERNKELPRQQEETQATIKMDARRVQLLSSEVQGRSRRPRRKKDGLTVQSYDADADTCDSDDSEERLEAGRFGQSIQTLQPALEEALSRGAGDYKGRLRPITKKKWNLDVLYTLEEQDSSDDAFEDSEKSEVKVLRDYWGAKKRRTDRGSTCETRQVSSLPKSTQETENINLRDHGSAKAPSKEGFLEWISCKRKRANDRRPSAGWGSAGWGSAPEKHEISSKEKHPGRPLDDGNVVAGRGTIRSGSPLSSVEGIGSSCKRNQPPRRCNMVAEVESCPRELGGLHEGPATPMTPPIRKRKAGNLSDGFPEARGLDALCNRRARSDGTEKAMQGQYYQLSSNGEEATEHSRRAVAGWCDQTPPPSSILPFENFEADQFDAFINGEFNKDPGFDNLDAFANGQLYRPTSSVNGSQFYWGRESSPTLPLNDLGACIKYPETSYFKGGEGVFPVQDRGAFSVASESGTNDDSLGTAQSDEDYHPPPRYVILQSMTDNVGAQFQTSYPSRSRRSLSFRNDGVTRRVGSTSPLSSDAQPPAATRTLPNTADVMHVNPILDNQQASLSTPIAPSVNGACMGIVDVEEDSEAEDGNLQDEDYEEEGEGLFDLNEPPAQQQQRKNLKARKKHRPKVFREGRPSRRRKPKNPEEEIAKKKASEAKKVGEKPRGRKKRATTDLKSSQGDRFEKQGSHSTPAASNCVSGIAACGQCRENPRVSDAQRGTPSQAVLQTPFPEIVLVRRPNNPLTGEIARPHAPDSSSLLTSPSPSPNLSRKRVDEEDRLIVTDSPLSQRGPRRELFKRARSKQSRAVFEQGLRLGDKPQESLLLESQEPSMGEALVDPRASIAEVAGPVMVRGWNSSNPEEGVLGRSLLIPTEVGSNTSFSKRMRAAARAKGSRSNLSNRVTKPRSIRIPSISRRVKKQMEKQMDSITPWGQVVNRLANMELNENNFQLVPHVNQQTAMVPYVGPFMPLRRKKPRPKVMLDEEDKRVWRLVMTQGTGFTDDNSEKEAPRQWDEEKAIMKARAEKFINLMHLVQGDRRFSVWKGSVVDSVVGAFLTQNVSDHLSSSAFMCLAARFPVARKKKPAGETSQEPTVTEVQMEESFEVSQKRPELSEAVQEASVAAFHVEEVVEISEKSSAIGGGSDICCVAAFHVEEALEVSEKSSGTGEGSGICRNGQAQAHTGTVSHTCAEERLTDFKEQNSSCSSKDCQSKCHSSLCKAAFHAGENLEVRESEEQKTFALVEHFTSLQSGLEDVVLLSSGRSHMNSISSRALVDISEREGTQMALASHDRWIGSELSGGSLIVDLGLPKHDLEHMDEVRKSIFKDFHSPSNNLRTHEARGNSAPEEKICSSPLPGVEGICASAEEVAASSGSVVSSSDSVDAHNLCQASVVPGVEINCANGEEIEANAAGVIFPSDSFDSGNSYDKQLVVSAADTDNQLRRRLSLLTESSNLHTLKSLIRTSPKKTGPKARDVNGKKSSELVTSTENDQEQEVRGRGRGKRPVIGLSGLDRARLEESNITSKVAFDWEAVRLKYTEPEMGESPHESAHAGCKSFGSSNVENGVDWDAVRAAKLEDIADVIKERGMNNVLAGRIKAFLERVQKEHGSVDLEWLRTVPVEESKSFLLSIRGLGLKSVECVRLLCLHQLAFPVDTNVGRICVRLGWVPLEPLPEELQLHLLELYPVQETIQKYLWPRLCSLDQRTLYELHYQMITFGKVFCTKSRPNCNACPMRDDCRHFASALASAKLALPAPAPEDSQSTSSEPLALPAAAAEFMEKVKLALPAGEEGAGLSNLNSFIASQKPCEPIVEEPSTPEPVVANSTDIEDMEQLFGRDEEPETVFGVSSQTSDKGSGTFVEIILPPAEVSIPDPVSKALVCLPPGSESLPVPKLKNAGRLRTVHYVYELPDNHPLVQGMDPREADDPCVYLLAIWSPGESPEAPPVLDDMHTNGTCDGFNGSEEETVKGTVLVPCRTAMRGIFPLNGTYFQVNEVFADHASSIQPIEVPRTLLWNLRRRFVYFGTSVTTIFKNLSVEEIQACFWRGYVCVRGFDSVSRCPRPLAARLHFPASKMIKKTKEGKPIEEEA